jgi:hypothetical protein
MNRIIEVGGKFYATQQWDTEFTDPRNEPMLDGTGQVLKVGSKVAWGTAYRGGRGAALGEIISIGFTATSYSAHEVEGPDSGKYVMLEEEYPENKWDPHERRYVVTGKMLTRKVYAPRLERKVWTFELTTKALSKGRKGASFRDREDVVLIANQDYNG